MSRVKVVEIMLRDQIVQAIEPEYIDGILDSSMNIINLSIPEIIDYLQENYGQITPEKLNLREDALKNTVFGPFRPPSLIFTKIK